MNSNRFLPNDVPIEYGELSPNLSIFPRFISTLGSGTSYLGDSHFLIYLVMFRRKKPESNAPPGIGGGSRVKQTRAEKQAEAAQKAAQPKKRGEVPELMAVRDFLAWIIL